MADIRLLNPYARKRKGLINLVHFAWRFPSHVITNNCRVDLGYVEFSYQLLDRQKFSNYRISKDSLLRVCLDLDEYLVKENISVEKIDEAITSFRTIPLMSTNPADFVPFSDLAKPIFTYLVDEKKHEIDSLFG